MARIVVTVSPGATRSELAGRHGDSWKARIAAPPERGRANEALLDLLAEALGLPRSRLALVGSRSARRKIVEVEGLDLDEIERRLDR